MIDVWRAGAPHIDLVAPDIYNRDEAEVAALLGDFDRPDNALMVPETGNSIDHARFFWEALGHGTIGYAPFGMDLSGYSNYPLGAKSLDAETIQAFASKYRLFAPIASIWARIAATRPVWGTAKGSDGADQSRTIGRWRITASYGLWSFGERDWTWIKTDPNPNRDRPVGGMVAASLGPDEFLVAGSDVRIRFALDRPAPGETAAMVRVEEGSFAPDGSWVMRRVWNGDQTDYGLNFGAEPVLLRVKLGSYR
jgi:beta-galactosidase GanA